MNQVIEGKNPEVQLDFFTTSVRFKIEIRPPTPARLRCSHGPKSLHKNTFFKCLSFSRFQGFSIYPLDIRRGRSFGTSPIPTTGYTHPIRNICCYIKDLRPIFKK